MLNITVTEDLNSGPRARLRFCATVEGDTNEDRGGFGPSEKSALFSLARQLDMVPLAMLGAATIERVCYR